MPLNAVLPKQMPRPNAPNAYPMPYSIQQIA